MRPNNIFCSIEIKISIVAVFVFNRLLLLKNTGDHINFRVIQLCAQRY